MGKIDQASRQGIHMQFEEVMVFIVVDVFLIMCDQHNG